MVHELGGDGEEQPLLVVGSHCQDVIYRDGRLVAEGLGGASSFVSNVLDGALRGHPRRARYVSKVGADFSYDVAPPPLTSASRATTLFHAHFSSSDPVRGSSDRVLKRVRACDPILPADLPAGHYTVGLAVGVAGEIPPETLARMLDICRLVLVDAQALIRTFDPVDGAVGLAPLQDTAYFPLLRGIAFLKASEEEASFVDVEETRKGSCVLVTRGKEGCSVYWNDGDFNVPAFPTEEVDPTGAGDSFLGGFVAGLLSKLTIWESALLGNFFGSITVSQIGVPKLNSTVLQKIRYELERRSVPSTGLRPRNILLDFNMLDVCQDFRTSLIEAAKLECSDLAMGNDNSNKGQPGS